MDASNKKNDKSPPKLHKKLKVYKKFSIFHPVLFGVFLIKHLPSLFSFLGSLLLYNLKRKHFNGSMNVMIIANTYDLSTKSVSPIYLTG